MDKLELSNKLRVLGYDPPGDLVSSFKELILKLEDEQIKHYGDTKRDKFKSTKGSEFIKTLKTYLNDLNLNFPEGFFTGNQLSDRQKLDVLNKVLNLSLKQKYKTLCEEGSIAISEPKAFGLEQNSNDNKPFVLQKLNQFLQSLNLPPLDETSKHSDVKTTLELYLKYIQTTKTTDHNCTHGDQSSSKDVISELSNSAEFQNEFTKHLRALYSKSMQTSPLAGDLCTLQSEIIWLTKEFTKLPTKQ